MSLAAELKMRPFYRDIGELQKVYAQAGDNNTRLDWQLIQFNQEWARIRHTVPFYIDMSAERFLPDRFTCWDQVVDLLPVIDRGVVQAHRDRLTSQVKPPQWSRITGGSTSQPIQLPAWNSEKATNVKDLWLARSWFNVRPSDRLFMIWGHSHLLGSGFKGKVNQFKRQLSDYLLGYYRFSAYDLNENKMKEAGETLLRFRPHYVIGYSVALDAFARANRHREDDFRQLGLKLVIGAAEGFPSNDSVKLIEQVLGAPVAMEYGSVETNLIAHSTPEKVYQVFWRTFFVEAVETGVSGGRVVRVTSLYPRAFPLVRYEIGDEIETLPEDNEGLGVSRFMRVNGRCNDFITLEDGSRIHSEAVTHSVRSCQKITGYQFIQERKFIWLHLTTSSPLTPVDTEAIRHRFRVIHPLLERIEILTVDRLEQTVAGKTRMIISKVNGK